MSAEETDQTEQTKDDDKPKRRILGCGTGVFLAGAAALAGGVYLMGKWDAIGGSAKASAIILVILGTLLLLPFIIVIGLRVIIKLVLGKVTKEPPQARAELEGGRAV